MIHLSSNSRKFWKSVHFNNVLQLWNRKCENYQNWKWVQFLHYIKIMRFDQSKCKLLYQMEKKIMSKVPLHFCILKTTGNFQNWKAPTHITRVLIEDWPKQACVNIARHLKEMSIFTQSPINLKQQKWKSSK